MLLAASGIRGVFVVGGDFYNAVWLVNELLAGNGE